MKGQRTGTICSSVAACCKIFYDLDNIILLSRAFACLPCRMAALCQEENPLKLTLDIFGLIASTKAGCMKLILAGTVNTLYSYLQGCH